MNRQFPCLEVHLDRLYHNAYQVISRCHERGIAVCGIVKGVEGMPPIITGRRTYIAPFVNRSAPAAWSRWPAAAPQAWRAPSC